jgi:hypothetical protein
MEKQMLYGIADSFFFVFHIVLILFNLFGWIYKPWRKLNLITLSLTAFSWIILGIFYGFGYCFLTDWHWQIREKTGETIESDSYIHFLITETTGISIPEELVDVFTTIFFFCAWAVSIYLNIRDRSGNKK